jgi:catechol 2,3-dioxygenase-like lactoylglutathione lyase family enzyme
MDEPRLSAAVPVLPVRDIARAAEFWRARLGFAVVHADGGYAVLARDAVEIHLWAARDEGWVDRPGRPVVSGAETFLAGTASCRVRAAAIAALYEEMRAAEVVHPNGPLSDKPYGLTEFAVLDLDGNLVTFFAQTGPPGGTA